VGAQERQVERGEIMPCPVCHASGMAIAERIAKALAQLRVTMIDDDGRPWVVKPLQPQGRWSSREFVYIERYKGAPKA